MTPLQYALLGLLVRQPMSGYDLTKLFEERLGHVWKASHSQIYPDLAHLQAQGFIAQAETGPRGRKTYQTTEAGLAEVRHWLRETRPDRRPQFDALLRASFLWLLEKSEARDYLAQEATYHRRVLQQLGNVKKQITASPWAERPGAQSVGIVLEAGVRYATAMAEWAEWAAIQFDGESPSRPDPQPEEGE
jgi:DNA-binding PadR family transcriptional regulator